MSALNKIYTTNTLTIKNCRSLRNETIGYHKPKIKKNSKPTAIRFNEDLRLFKNKIKIE